MLKFKEDFLHFIWKFQLFNVESLATTRGEKISILQTGIHNQNQGADFLQAAIRLGNNTFYGNIEIHIQNADWYQHRHHLDTNYDNTILHVVYQMTDEIYTLNSKNHQIPILCLAPYISPKTIENIDFLMSEKAKIPCHKIYQLPSKIHLQQFKTRLFSERIIRKSAWIKDIILQNGNDYESSFYQALLYGFGIKVNADIFFKLAHSLPQKILARYIDDKFKLEALFYGQANMLSNIDDYSTALTTEYRYLSQLHRIKPIETSPLRSKMLPSSFPTIRLAQFVALIYQQHGLFSKLTEFRTIDEIRGYFNIEVSDYWQKHYDFGKPNTKSKNATISASFFEKLLINVILPFKFLLEIELEKPTTPTIELYHRLKAEINHKTQIMTDYLGLENKNAFDSQSLNEWFTYFCSEKKCFDCAIGYHTLKIDL